MQQIKSWLKRTWLSRVIATSNHLKDRQTTEEEKLLFSVIGPGKHKNKSLKSRLDANKNSSFTLGKERLEAWSLKAFRTEKQ